MLKKQGKPSGLAEDATDEEKKAAKAAVKESQKESSYQEIGFLR